VRLEAENPGYLLRPDMYVDVELPIKFSPTLTVPADAVLDSGLRKTVFVDRGNGFFEPRTVETGWRSGDEVQICGGLMPDERVVVSGNFLLDSESRMKQAAAGSRGASATDPVCGMEVEEASAKAANRLSEHGGTTYCFRSEGCKQKFEADLAKYLAKGQPPFTNMAIVEPNEAIDPVCKMGVNMPEAKAAKHVSEYQGRTYSFCSEICKKRFDAGPDRFMEKRTPAGFREMPAAPGVSNQPPAVENLSGLPSPANSPPAKRRRGSAALVGSSPDSATAPSLSMSTNVIPPRDQPHH
jgi:YHS domain-containing protein